MNDASTQQQTISESGKPPRSVIKDAKSAYNIWEDMRLADAEASFDRARIDAAYNNDKPFSDEAFKRAGQSYRMNVSWGWAKEELDAEIAGYTDIYNSNEVFFHCPTKYGDPTEREGLERVVALEISKMARSWPDHFTNYISLCTKRTKHGIAVKLPLDDSDWRWIATDLSDLKMPRDTRAGMENITLIGCLRFYSPQELYDLISDTETAEDAGYNIKAIRKSIINAVQNSSALDRYKGYEWEKLEDELRNNAYFFGNRSQDSKPVRVIKFWAKEYGGKISEYMLNEDQSVCPDFLYENVGKYESIHEALTIFTRGVGTNGYYYGIRGQGYDIFPIHGALNIATCQMLELATYGSAPTFQPSDENAMQEMQFLPTGPFNLITPGIQVLPNTTSPNLANGPLSVIQALGQMMKGRTSQRGGGFPGQGGERKTKYQVQSEGAEDARMNIADLNLFYDPWECHWKDVVRRIIRKDYSAEDPGGEYIVALKERLRERGRQGNGDPERYIHALYALDYKQLKVTRAIGEGSEASRMLAFDRIMSLYGSLPDYGKQNALYDMVSATVGHRNAERYAIAPGEEEVPTYHASIAQLENATILGGSNQVPIMVLDGQNDLVHARVHFSAEVPLVEQAEQALGQNDPGPLMQIMPGLNALNQHNAEHVQRLSQDPMMQVESAEMRKMLQNFDEILNNAMKHIQKLQRLQQESSTLPNGQPAQQEQGQFPDDATLSRIQNDMAIRKAKMSAMQMESEQKLALNLQKFQQEKALRDAKTAAELMRP